MTADRACLDIVIAGLSITSSWGNGHATTYRSLVRELIRLGHRVLFLERDAPWYAANRDLPKPPYGRTALYRDLAELKDRFAAEVRDADCVVVGSYVPEGVQVGRWVTRTAGGLTAFYDIDTPITLAKLEDRDYEYLHPDLIARYGLYLSFTGGPTLELIEKRYGSPAARPLYCSVDPELYYPQAAEPAWHMGYMGTYSADRQPPLERMMLQAARRWPQGQFVVAGPQYPKTINWPANVERIEHLPPAGHREFYNRQSFTLNVTRQRMVRAGYSPSVRLFEAAACGTPIISDSWPGFETILEPGREVLISRNADETLAYLRDMPESDRRLIGQNARRRILQSHTAARRAAQFERYIMELTA